MTVHFETTQNKWLVVLQGRILTAPCPEFWRGRFGSTLIQLLVSIPCDIGMGHTALACPLIKQYPLLSTVYHLMKERCCTTTKRWGNSTQRCSLSPQAWLFPSTHAQPGQEIPSWAGSHAQMSFTHSSWEKKPCFFCTVQNSRKGWHFLVSRMELKAQSTASSRPQEDSSGLSSGCCSLLWLLLRNRGAI